MGYLKKIRDAKIRNGRPTRQKLLEDLEKFAEKEPLIESVTIEDLGDCGSFGERLYDEGTELCDCCELSETCFANYKLWREEKL